VGAKKAYGRKKAYVAQKKEEERKREERVVHVQVDWLELQNAGVFGGGTSCRTKPGEAYQVGSSGPELAPEMLA
jgi:hypothetical protein